MHLLIGTYGQELVFIPVLFCRKHSSSQYYFLKLLLMTSISLKISTLFTIFLLFEPALFIVCTGINFFVFSSYEGKIVEASVQY